MQVKYVGVFADDGVELADRLGGQWFNGHEATDVSAELAAQLLAQPLNWEPADTEAEDLAQKLLEASFHMPDLATPPEPAGGVPAPVERAVEGSPPDPAASAIPSPTGIAEPAPAPTMEVAP